MLWHLAGGDLADATARNLALLRISDRLGVEHSLFGPKLQLGSQGVLLRLVLVGESALILRVAITPLKHELADASVRIQGQRGMSEVHDFQNLMVRDARVHESRSDMYSQTEPGESTSPFQAAGYIVGQCDLLPRDPENHLARLDHHKTAVFHVDAARDVLEPGVVGDVVDFGPLLEYSEVVSKRKIDRPGADLRSIERVDPDRSIV